MNQELHDLFMEELESNEECMGECAAFDITCQMFDLSHEDAYQLMIEYDYEEA